MCLRCFSLLNIFWKQIAKQDSNKIFTKNKPNIILVQNTNFTKQTDNKTNT